MFCSPIQYLIEICNPFQRHAIIKNIEKITFWAGDNQKIRFAKQELLSQINYLDISISGKGFFTIDRKFMAEVSLGSSIRENTKLCVENVVKNQQKFKSYFKT